MAHLSLVPKVRAFVRPSLGVVILAALGACGDAPVTRALGECGNPAPVVVEGVDTGVVRCDGTFLRRKAAGSCPSRVPRVGVKEGDKNTECESDVDCTAKPYGWCGRSPRDWQSSVACQYGCGSDSDCKADELCACDDTAPTGMCVPASCRTDDDCPGAALCTARRTTLCGAPAHEWGCQSESDECTAKDECAKGQELCVRGACMQGAGACGGV